jgi:hypothetical protein
MPTPSLIRRGQARLKIEQKSHQDRQDSANPEFASRLSAPLCSSFGIVLDLPCLASLNSFGLPAGRRQGDAGVLQLILKSLDLLIARSRSRGGSTSSHERPSRRSLGFLNIDSRADFTGSLNISLRDSGGRGSQDQALIPDPDHIIEANLSGLARNQGNAVHPGLIAGGKVLNIKLLMDDPKLAMRAAHLEVVLKAKVTLGATEHETILNGDE